MKLQFQRGLGKVAYHAPCHGRVQNIGNPTEVFLQLIAHRSTGDQAGAQVTQGPTGEEGQPRNGNENWLPGFESNSCPATRFRFE